MRQKKFTLLRARFLALAMCCSFILAHGQGKYVAGDFHQHTTYTDGSYSFGYMMDKNNQFGLDWWANSEHGGAFNRWGKVSGIDLGTSVTWDKTGVTLKGKANDNNMWRWQSLTEWSFTDVLLYRRIMPDKLIVEAYEMNVPGHEHASLGIIGNQFAIVNSDVKELALFEYLFDAVDTDDSSPFASTETKLATNDHAKAVAAAQWLQTNHQGDSWFIPAHPERYRYPSGVPNYEGWNIEHFRDLNNVAPDVFFGFESVPGHQASVNRGEYYASRGDFGSYGICTYGGAGWMTAKVGGLWDALLSEGRHFWLFANSDCHIVTNADGSSANADFFPGEYQKNYTYVTEKNNPQAIVDGLRSGNSYNVMGDLIDSLTFTVSGKMMGETVETDNNSVEVYIKVRNSQQDNNNIYGGTKRPVLDHIDLIAGVVTGKITPPETIPADGKTGYSDAYKCDSVNTTKVIARFGAAASGADPCGIATTAWTDLGNGWKEIHFTADLPQNMYFRLRGTNQPLNTKNETDACGNPLPDTLMETNDAAKAFADLWFYSNPVFANTTNPSTSSIRINEISTNGTTQYNGLDWVELYNPTNSAIEMTGYTLDDSNSDSKGTTAKLDSITIPAKGFKVLIETVHFPFGLGASGDMVTLKRNGNLADRIIYTSNIADKTLGRIQDGEGDTDVTYNGEDEIGGWKLYNSEDATIGASNNTITFVFTSDQHYGITRPNFRGVSNENATVVNAALVSQINKLNDIDFPDDGEVNSGKRININYVISTGDFSNRSEAGVSPKSHVTFAQFVKDYVNGLTLQDFKGSTPILLIAPGNHDVSDAIGQKSIPADSLDVTAMVEIYNRMMNPAVPKTTETYNYNTDKVNYIKMVGDIQFVFVNMWPDAEGRQWISDNMDVNKPAFIFTHDQPEVEAKHFTDPSWASGSFNFNNGFEYELSQKASQPSSSGSTEAEQRELAAFISANPNIKAYFHGNDHINGFYTFTGPDNNISLPVFRVDSPMKGIASINDETKLTFQIVTINRNTKQITDRNCLWNTTADANAPIVFGDSITISY